MAGSDVTPVEAGDHILFVYTMTHDDSIEVDELVKVRVYEGESDHELGERIFNGTIALTKPVLAIGEIMAAPEDMYQTPLANPGLLPLQIFARTTLDDVSGPNEISILLPDGSSWPP